MRILARTALFIALSAALWSCASVEPSESRRTPEGYTITPLGNLLAQCENDLKKGSEVIRERDIIKNLTHLQRMDSGGAKYYILERENISKMIAAVTDGVYRDFILLNRKGTVVYTKDDDSIQGKNVRTSLAGTPLQDCFTGQDDLGFGSLSWTPFRQGEFLYPSLRIHGGERSSGIFVLKIKTQKLRDLLSPGTRVLDKQGIVLISRNEKEEGSPHPQAAGFLAARDFPSRTVRDGGFTYRPFVRGALSLILLSEDE